MRHRIVFCSRAGSRRKRAGIIVVGVALLAGGVVPAAEAAPQSIAAAVKAYTPIVHLHEDDGNGPMNAADFIGRSELRWDHEGRCYSDSKVARPVDARTLGIGGYRHQKKDGFRCNHGGREYTSAENTRPKGDGVAGDDGFFLDLDNDARRGEGTTAPAYFEAADGAWITYWLFYGFNDFTARFNHEGDWEKVAVYLDKNNRATGVYYSAHHGGCRTGAPSGRPESYAAKGSHANYPRPGTYESRQDHASDKGPAWATQNRLEKLTDQPWYGYGGGWGEVGEFSDTTGPLGPHPQYKPSAPAPDAKPC